MFFHTPDKSGNRNKTDADGDIAEPVDRDVPSTLRIAPVAALPFLLVVAALVAVRPFTGLAVLGVVVLPTLGLTVSWLTTLRLSTL